MAQCAQNPERECVCDARVQGLQRELDRAHETHAEIFDRLGKLERDNVLQTEQIKTLVDTMNRLMGKLDALVARLDEIQDRPGRRLANIKDKVIVGVATSLGTALVIALLVLAVNNL
mgnify:FL=1